MTNIEIVGEQIEARPDGICDKCIGSITGVKPYQQVVQICHKLVDRSRSVRVDGKCPHCGEQRLLNKPMVVVLSRGTNSPQGQATATETRTNPPDFDNLRKLLIPAPSSP